MFIFDHCWWFLKSMYFLGFFPYKKVCIEDSDQSGVLAGNLILSFARYVTTWILTTFFSTGIILIVTNQEFNKLSKSWVDFLVYFQGSKTDILCYGLSMSIAFLGNILITLKFYRIRKNLDLLQGIFTKEFPKVGYMSLKREKILFATFIMTGFTATVFMAFGFATSLVEFLEIQNNIKSKSIVIENFI